MNEQIYFNYDLSTKEKVVVSFYELVQRITDMFDSGEHFSLREKDAREAIHFVRNESFSEKVRFEVLQQLYLSIGEIITRY